MRLVAVPVLDGRVNRFSQRLSFANRRRSLSSDAAFFVSGPPRSLSENSVVGPRASHFFAGQRRRSRRWWFYRRCSRMPSGGKRAARSQIEFSDRLQEPRLPGLRAIRETLSVVRDIYVYILVRISPRLSLFFRTRYFEWSDSSNSIV